MIKGTFGTSQKTRPNRTASHELIMLHSRLEVPNMFQSLGDLLLVVPFMLHGCKYKAMIRVYIYIYIYIQRYTPISIEYTEHCQTWVSHPMELLAPALG